ncbi:helix-turn-helix domain-containing protein [Enterococcus innesii]|uniref:helix-turn-helix domain-containing protein n=1 Tax=Enterococcus innesii TaxID=2839759 RepID=UPI002DBBBF5D|nr:helix-turn-helix domain-containing protein [Enterococcus innesii]MEB5953106.1 helix-turn-helix domain-containing protein [Enterococcus innesii]
MASKNMEQQLTEQIFIQREEGDVHLAFEREMSFYNAVKKGDLDMVYSLMLPLQSKGLGNLSSDIIQELKYHLVITIAMITRSCVEGGLDLEMSYTLSDLYIQKVDKCTSTVEINSLHHSVIVDFTKRMQNLDKQRAISKPIIKVLEYISRNLHEVISVQTLADHVTLNPSYLSTLFKKEMHISLSEYIRIKKVDSAKNLLRFSDKSFTEISNYLGFHSQSHFIAVFKKQTSMTPKEYRDTHFRKAV